jgi:hypothetical protein
MEEIEIVHVFPLLLIVFVSSLMLAAPLSLSHSCALCCVFVCCFCCVALTQSSCRVVLFAFFD